MRNFQWFVAGLGSIILAGLYSDFASAAPPAPVTTLWNFLGIPQAADKIQDASLNRLGNNPDLERTPALKSIADPSNLDPSMPKSIQAAAKIKQQEDLAPQKIKAIKYLATVGCGCHAKDGVQDALLDSLDDCTEAVRYEAALALAKVAGSCCDPCSNTCCSAKVMSKLKALADGTDDRCCKKESSERVREAALKALNACKNKLPATNVTPSVPEPEGGHHAIPEGADPGAPMAPSPKSLIPPPPVTPNPTPTPAKRPLDLPGDAPGGNLVPPAKTSRWSQPGSSIAVASTAESASHVQAQPVASKIETISSVNKSVQLTAGSASAEAPVRLKLVIGGEDADNSAIKIEEPSNSGVQK